MGAPHNRSGQSIGEQKRAYPGHFNISFITTRSNALWIAKHTVRNVAMLKLPTETVKYAGMASDTR